MNGFRQRVVHEGRCGQYWWLVSSTCGMFELVTAPRWKEMVEAKPGRFTHHLELHTRSDIKGDVRSWLERAWVGAG